MSKLIQKDFDKIESIVNIFMNMNLCKIKSVNLNKVVTIMHNLSFCIQEILTEENKGEIVNLLKPYRKFLSRSPLYKRVQEWPRGYQGDFETLEVILQKKIDSKKNTINYYCDYYALQSGLILQHINKMTEQAYIILQTCLLKTKNIKILLLGSSNCYDLRLIQDLIQDISVEFILIDTDKDALEYSKNKLIKIRDRCTFIHTDIIKALRLVSDMNFDLIVTGGLMDYIPDKLYVLLLKNLYSCSLKNNGKIYITNISPDNPYKIMMEYFISWNLIDRSKKQLIELFKKSNIDSKKITIKRDATNITYLIEITK